MKGASWVTAAVALGCGLALSLPANAAAAGALSEAAGVKVANAQSGAEGGPTSAGQPAEPDQKTATPGCVKVKVVYAGYGEAARAGCAAGSQ